MPNKPAECRWIYRIHQIIANIDSGLFSSLLLITIKESFEIWYACHITFIDYGPKVLWSPHMRLLHYFEVSIWSLGIKYFITVHHSNKVFSLWKVYDVVGVAGKHMDTTDILSGNFEFYDFVWVYAAFLNKAVTWDDDEELPLAIMPMLAFGDRKSVV